MFKCRKEEAGLTIVEVILSLAIIGIIAAVFIPMFTMSAK
ncbi:MAG: type II secretion system protein, partial [Tissierellia bacterium]|nr:type II secretion system protein [Tissierellia bacterium]